MRFWAHKRAQTCLKADRVLPLSEKVKDRRCVRKTSEGNLPERVGKKMLEREMTNLLNMVLVPLLLWLLTELARWHLMTLFFSGETGLMQGYEETFCVLVFSQKHQSINGQHFNISSITQLNMQPKHQHAEDHSKTGELRKLQGNIQHDALFYLICTM